MSKKTMKRYAVFVNDELFPRSICLSVEGAGSYLDDAKHANAPESHVRVVELTIRELPVSKVEDWKWKVDLLWLRSERLRYLS